MQNLTWKGLRSSGEGSMAIRIKIAICNACASVQNHCLRSLCIGSWSKMHMFYEKVTVCDVCASDVCPKSQFATPVHRILVLNQKRFHEKETVCDTCASDFVQNTSKKSIHTTVDERKSCLKHIRNMFLEGAGVVTHPLTNPVRTGSRRVRTTTMIVKALVSELAWSS